MAAVAIALGLAAAAYLAALLLLQRTLLFPRPEMTGTLTRPTDARQVWLTVRGVRGEAWYLPPRSNPADRVPAVVFFHGNAELIDYQPADFEEPRRWGMGVLLVEFPGYGRSAGSPSEESITATALAAFDWAVAEPSIDARRVVVHGRSLGGGAAAALAAKRPAAALVLESTFTSVRSFAHRFFAPDFAILDPFDNVAALKAYSGPVLILHGDRDELIPPAHAHMLRAASRSAEVHFLPCGHNDCARPWELIHEFLGRNGVLTPHASE